MHTRVELSHLIRLRCLTLLSPFISSKSRLSRDVNKYIDDVYPTMKVIFFASTLLLIDSNQICYGFYARRIVKLVLGLSVRHWDMLHILWVTHQRPPKDRRGYKGGFYLLYHTGQTGWYRMICLRRKSSPKFIDGRLNSWRKTVFDLLAVREWREAALWATMARCRHS